MIWKDKHLANLWGNLSIHLLNGERCNRITKMKINDSEDLCLQFAGTAAISISPRRKAAQMLLSDKTVRCQVPSFTQFWKVQDSAQGKMRRRHLTFCWKKYSKEAEALGKQQPDKRSNIFNLSCLVLSFNEDFIY